jgi:hypothetical protein
MINDLLSNQADIVGWETAQNLLKAKYYVDLSDSIEISEFVSDFVEGKFQSGISEFRYAST